MMEMLTVAEAAKIAKISRDKLYELVRTKSDIPHIRIGSKILLPQKKFLNWLGLTGLENEKEKIIERNVLFISKDKKEKIRRLLHELVDVFMD